MIVKLWHRVRICNWCLGCISGVLFCHRPFVDTVTHRVSVCERFFLHMLFPAFSGESANGVNISIFMTLKIIKLETRYNSLCYGDAPQGRNRVDEESISTHFHIAILENYVSFIFHYDWLKHQFQLRFPWNSISASIDYTRFSILDSIRMLL